MPFRCLASHKTQQELLCQHWLPAHVLLVPELITLYRNMITASSRFRKAQSPPIFRKLWFKMPFTASKCFFPCETLHQAKKKNLLFFWGVWIQHIFLNKISQNTLLSDGLVFTHSYFLKVKSFSKWNPGEIHNWLQWDQDIAFKVSFSPQGLDFVY